MKHIIYIALVLSLLFTYCKKEVQKEEDNYDYENYQDQDNYYIRGIITDSITGLPLSGYNANPNYYYPSCANTDTIVNGEFLLYSCTYRDKVTSITLPDTVIISLYDTNDSVVKEYSFPSSELIVNDTITKYFYF